MYGLNVKINAVKGKGDELSFILLEASKLMEKDSTCHLYVVGKDPENDDVIWMTEVWQSKEDHDRSLQNEEVRGLIGNAFPLMEGKPTNGIELKILGGKGL